MKLKKQKKSQNDFSFKKNCFINHSLYFNIFEKD